MSKPSKKPYSVEKDILGMFGIQTKQAPKQPATKPEKPKVMEAIPIVSQPSIPTMPEPIPASSEPDMIEPPLIEVGPTPAADHKWDNYLPKDIAPALYKRGPHGWFMCRNCGRGFEGRPIIINWDHKRVEKWNVNICPLCGGYGLVECGKTAVEPALEAELKSNEAARKIYPDMKEFIIGNPNVKLLEYSKDPYVIKVYGEKNGKGQV